MPVDRTRLRQLAIQALAWIVLILLLVGIYYGARAAIATFTALNPTVAAGFIAAVSAIVVSVISVLIAKHLEQRALIAKEQREKKIPAYEELIEFLFHVIYNEKLGRGPMPEQEMVERMIKFNQKALIWGSDEVIQAFGTFRRVSAEGAPALTIAVLVERMLLAIRKDLGHKNRGLGPGSLLGTFINDLHKL